MKSVDREMDLERLGTRFSEMEGRHLWREGAWILSQIYVTASRAVSTLHRLYSVLGSSVRPHAPDTTVYLSSTVSSQVCSQRWSEGFLVSNPRSLGFGDPAVTVGAQLAVAWFLKNCQRKD